ncbi:GH92 family glycosyl hydrolase [Posidoniimonas polymericola]|uniref:GH92 family glycosyl hydrolase n=1 Tax=Posidoniimonas polymericola TaxID=2528002 RepID=UPI001E3A148D|nr:GH92 family glycosyl hydrolase [Posidoniimonas polymericola]
MLAALLPCVALLSVSSGFEPADYVNPFIGASTSTAKAGVLHGLGKTFPGATTPFGMVQVNPNTITGGDNGPGYSYEMEHIEGFAFTQMSGIGWYGDLGNFLVTPTTGELQVVAGRHGEVARGYRSRYDKQSEVAEAGYYAATLTDYDVRVEATAAPRAGMLRLTYPEHQQSRVQIDLAHRTGGTSTHQSVRVVGDNAIEGAIRCTPDGGGWGNGDGHADYTVYYRAEFSKPLANFGVWKATIPAGQSRRREAIESAAYDKLIAAAEILDKPEAIEGDHLGFFTEFATDEGEQVLVKVGISYASVDGARANLAAEIPGWDFDQQRQAARGLWNDALSRVAIAGGSDDQRTIFYTALYHTMIDPRAIVDVDGGYPGGDGKRHTAHGFTKRTIFSGWDVFRSQFPLQSIINPSVVTDTINSLIELADDTGRDYLERWEMLNAYSGCMLGNPAVVVIADAYAKGLRDFDLERAYELCRDSVERDGNGQRGHAGGISHTLEFAYTEWCLSQLADALGHDADARLYAERAQSYRNLFDPRVGWFRPRGGNGDFQPWPAKGRLQQDYGSVESNPYQQGWFVPHDLDGLVGLLGGRAAALADLESFFDNTPSDFRWNDYYNHANEPVHHVPFLFNVLGKPWLTQRWTRTICDQAYHNSVEGLVGNEDVGQMSAWYVLASCGMHPITPGTTRYEVTSPAWGEARLRVGDDKFFTVTAHNQSPENLYIQSAKLDGKPLGRCWIDYPEIMSGATLELELGPEPNEAWGTR